MCPGPKVGPGKNKFKLRKYMERLYNCKRTIDLSFFCCCCCCEHSDGGGFLRCAAVQEHGLYGRVLVDVDLP